MKLVNPGVGQCALGNLSVSSMKNKDHVKSENKFTKFLLRSSAGFQDEFWE